MGKVRVAHAEEAQAAFQRLGWALERQGLSPHDRGCGQLGAPRQCFGRQSTAEADAYESRGFRYIGTLFIHRPAALTSD